jgi:hypothetical protein
MPDRPTVYLAGPMVFDPDPAPVFARMKAICDEHGLEGIAPLDGQIGLEGMPPGPDLLRRIVAADIGLMQRADAGAFCLDPFRRGAEMDAGTAFEVGYMHALGKPLVGWTRDPRAYPDKVAALFPGGLTTTGAGAQGGTSGSARDPDGVLVHSQGCVQNAMVHVGIERAGGTVVADRDWQVAFRGAVAALARRMLSPR